VTRKREVLSGGVLLADPDAVGLIDSFLGKDRMAVVAYASGYALDRLAIVQQNGENLPGEHRFELELGFYEVIGTNDAPKI
jgi:hypothetical protein